MRRTSQAHTGGISAGSASAAFGGSGPRSASSSADSMTSTSSSRAARASSTARCSLQHAARFVVRLGQDPLDLGVDLLRRLLGVGAALLRRTAMSRNALPLVAVVVDGAERVAHAELGDHRARDVGGALQVVLRAGRDLAERDLLGGAAAEQHRELAEQIARASSGSDPRAAAASCSRARRSRAARSRSCAPDRARAARWRRWRGPTRGTRRSRAPCRSSRASSRGRRSGDRSPRRSPSCSTAVLSLRAASSAASLTRLARSAPAKPAVRAAMTLRSTSRPSFTFLTWMRRISSRPLTSGLSTSTWRSKRPGRSSAGSSTSGRLVAPMMMTPLRASKPSISASSWLSVCSRSSWLPIGLWTRTLPSASSSSMKTMHGALASACAKRSRTRAAPTPTNISTNSEPLRLKNGTFASPATARASSVLPVPGGPTSSTPFGMRPPMLVYFFGVFRNSTISLQLLLGLVDAGDVREAAPSLRRRRRSSRGCARTTSRRLRRRPCGGRRSSRARRGRASGMIQPRISASQRLVDLAGVLDAVRLEILDELRDRRRGRS